MASGEKLDCHGVSSYDDRRWGSWIHYVYRLDSGFVSETFGSPPDGLPIGRPRGEGERCRKVIFLRKDRTIYTTD